MDLCSLSYVYVDEAAQRLLHLVFRALMAKHNIESAYRQNQVYPDTRWEYAKRACSTLIVLFRSALGSRPRFSRP